MKRACGVLLPISSLPSPYGIGTFSKEAYEFVDNLSKAGQCYWQILPLGPTSYGDSPYQSLSAFAGNLYYIDLDKLIEEGLLSKEDLKDIEWFDDKCYVDYGKLYENREKLLKKAYIKFKETLDENDSVKFNKQIDELLEDTKTYCLYQAIKNEQEGKSWDQWDEDLRCFDEAAIKKAKIRLNKEIEFFCWVQTVFNKQWSELKKYANDKGIEIIGDMPIYVAFDSAEAWSKAQLFLFDEEHMPKVVAGCPPDYFAKEGQLWGNPLYDWDYHKKNNYEWWIKRLEYALSVYDYVRVDHFRAFDEYYSIEYGAENAIEGIWNAGPGMNIFNKMTEYFQKKYPGKYEEGLPIIAEDLGLMTDSVIKLVEDSGFPAMKVLEFAFDQNPENMYLPHNYVRNCVAYTGTHDNSPLRAWLETLSHDDRLFMIRYQGSENTPYEYLHWDSIRTVMSSIADTVIIPMQDYLGLGEESRINTPSTMGNNWKWRMKSDEFSEELIWHMSMLSGIYGRQNDKNK